jgi:hypothetical protein
LYYIKPPVPAAGVAARRSGGQITSRNQIILILIFLADYYLFDHISKYHYFLCTALAASIDQEQNYNRWTYSPFDPDECLKNQQRAWGL